MLLGNIILIFITGGNIMKLITKSVSLLLVFVMAFSAMTIIPTQSAQIGKTGISDDAELGAQDTGVELATSTLTREYDSTKGTVRLWSESYPKEQNPHMDGVNSGESGEDIEIEVIPAAGYQLKSVKVTYGPTQRQIDVDENLHFKMPTRNTTVNVKVEFEPNNDDNSYDVHTDVVVRADQFACDRPADCTVSVNKDSAKYNETVTVTVNMGVGFRFAEDYNTYYAK